MAVETPTGRSRAIPRFDSGTHLRTPETPSTTAAIVVYSRFNEVVHFIVLL
jgi:hypothetical protein